MKKTIHLILGILCIIPSLFAQTTFDTFFERKSLRIDFSLSGNAKQQSAAIEQLRKEPVWSGPLNNLIDQFYYGGYYVNIYDKATNKLIYSRGFNTLFEEWRTTDQANTETQAWTNSVSVPYPCSLSQESNRYGIDGTRPERHAVSYLIKNGYRSEQYLY